ncbi:erythromycin esterase family protein [Nonomuraea sp. 3N208]|uniref:erythromycin esterase family protein n=1 Tax=Nonomuraea sp. 3N208 TaxID=3457421 RepID=UPI003FCDC374
MTWAAGPRQALTALHGYLAAWLDAGLLPCTAGDLDRPIGAGDRWSNPAAAMDAHPGLAADEPARRDDGRQPPGRLRVRPTLVYAHNRHLQREKSTWQLADMALEWWSAGAIVSARLGDQYAFLASALGAMPHQALRSREPTWRPTTDTSRWTRPNLGENDGIAFIKDVPA